MTMGCWDYDGAQRDGGWALEGRRGAGMTMACWDDGWAQGRRWGAGMMAGRWLSLLTNRLGCMI